MTDAIMDSKFRNNSFHIYIYPPPPSLHCHVSKFMEKYSRMKVSAKQLFNFLSHLWSVFPWEFEVRRKLKFKQSNKFTLPPTIRKCPVKHLQLFPPPLKTMTPKCSSFSYIFPHVRMDWKLNVKRHIEKSTSICWKTNKGILTKNNIRVLRLIFLMNHMDLQGGVL